MNTPDTLKTQKPRHAKINTLDTLTCKNKNPRHAKNEDLRHAKINILDALKTKKPRQT